MRCSCRSDRREEIINACAKLYETMSFKEITIKEIGQATSFTRTSIYNYFQTREEIFLALFQREYDLWYEDLKVLTEQAEPGQEARPGRESNPREAINQEMDATGEKDSTKASQAVAEPAKKEDVPAWKTMTKEEFARVLAQSLEKREQLLKLLSMNLYDMEDNSRLANLVEFKQSYKRVLEQMDACLKAVFPYMSGEDREGFIYAFFPFLVGVYPYTCVTDKQREAMEQAGVDYKKASLYELVYDCVMRLL